jgi:predicted nucleotidyltransferase
MFGSSAHGLYTGDSDVDFCLMLNEKPNAHPKGMSDEELRVKSIIKQVGNFLRRSKIIAFILLSMIDFIILPLFRGNV